MKKNKSDVTAATSLTLMLILFLTTNHVECLGSYLEGASCLSGGSGNASACSSGAYDETEYLMDEIEITRRILAGPKKTISYGATKANAPYCNAKVYANCIGPDGKFYKKRDCGLKEQCRTLP